MRFPRSLAAAMLLAAALVAAVTPKAWAQATVTTSPAYSCPSSPCSAIVTITKNGDPRAYFWLVVSISQFNKGLVVTEQKLWCGTAADLASPFTHTYSLNGLPTIYHLWLKGGEVPCIYDGTVSSTKITGSIVYISGADLVVPAP